MQSKFHSSTWRDLNSIAMCKLNAGTQHAPKVGPGREEPNRQKRSPWAPTAAMAPSLVAANELRVSGSKSEPPSRPTVDWSKQRPHFGQDMQRNVSVELGKTAYLTCKVFDLGDKTVSISGLLLLIKSIQLNLVCFTLVCRPNNNDDDFDCHSSMGKVTHICAAHDELLLRNSASLKPSKVLEKFTELTLADPERNVCLLVGVLKSRRAWQLLCKTYPVCRPTINIERLAE